MYGYVKKNLKQKQFNKYMSYTMKNINEHSIIYNDIKQDILNIYPNAFILWMSLIENDKLKENQIKLINDIEKRRNMKVDIKEMYRATKKNDIIQIAENGMTDEYFINTFYGQGYYYSNSIKYCSDYIKDILNEDISYVFLCDVVIGKYNKIYDFINTDDYDNSVNSVEDYDITVSPYKYGGIPKIIIAFNKN